MDILQFFLVPMITGIRVIAFQLSLFYLPFQMLGRRHEGPMGSKAGRELQQDHFKASNPV